MFCPQCGDEFREGFTYCNKCRTNLIEVLPPEVETRIRAQKKIGFKLQKISGKVIGLIGVILVYVVANMIFIGAQKLYHSRDQAKLDNVKTYLTTEKNEIDDMEFNLINTKNTLSSLKQEIDKTESQYPNGIPHIIYNKYTQNIDNYNGLIAKYNNIYNRYTESVDDYNKKVNEANILAKKVGTTWVIVPIPRSRSTH